MELERAANAHMSRGRLRDDWNDYAAGDSLMTRAFEIAPEGAGPFLGRARLNFTMHRFDRVEGDLAKAESMILLSPRTQSEIDALRADAALERGEFDVALAHYRSAVKEERNFDNLARLAGGLAKTGSLEAADRAYIDAGRALPRSATRERAWVSLQRGLVALQAHDLERALAHYRDAKKQYPGWWLADEHIAEALALEGHDDQALAIYQDVLARTGDPEFMDALARIYRHRGDEATASKWIRLARQGHAKRLARFPEAAMGHARLHIQEFGPITGGA
jgi:tetratricopeptide (TPR) repeat protein